MLICMHISLEYQQWVTRGCGCRGVACGAAAAGNFHAIWDGATFQVNLHFSGGGPLLRWRPPFQAWKVGAFWQGAGVLTLVPFFRAVTMR